MKALIGQLASLGFTATEPDNCLITSQEEGFAYTDLGTCDVLITWLKFGPSDVRETHAHPDLRVTFVRSGSAVVVLDGEPMDLGPGDMLLMLPQVPHGLRVTGQEPLRTMELVIQPLKGAEQR